MLYRIFLLVAAGLLVCNLVYADVPRSINFQGRLTDASGKFVPDGKYYLTFRLYSDSTGGTPKWSEAESVTVAKGLFNVILGSVTPIPYTVFEYTNTWLGIQVGGDTEMSPRQRIVSVAYAYKSLRADIADDGDWTQTDTTIYRVNGNVGIGTPDPANKLHVVANGTVFSLWVEQSGSKACIVAYKTGPGDAMYIVKEGHPGYGLSIVQRDPTHTSPALVISTSTTPVGASNILVVEKDSPYLDPIADDWTTYNGRSFYDTLNTLSSPPKEYPSEFLELTSEDYKEALKKVVSAPMVRVHDKGKGTELKIILKAEEIPEEILADGDNQAISLKKYITILHAALKAQQEEIENLKSKLVKLESRR